MPGLFINEPVGATPTRRLNPDHLGVGLHRSSQVFRLREVHERVLDPIVDCNLGKVPESTPVHIVHDTDVASGANQVDQRRGRH